MCSRAVGCALLAVAVWGGRAGAEGEWKGFGKDSVFVKLATSAEVSDLKKAAEMLRDPKKVPIDNPKLLPDLVRASAAAPPPGMEKAGSEWFRLRVFGIEFEIGHYLVITGTDTATYLIKELQQGSPERRLAAA